MQTFPVTTTSRLHYVLILLTGLLVFVVATLTLFPQKTNPFVFIGLFIVLSFALYKLAEKFSQQTVDLIIAPNYFGIEWRKQPLLFNRDNRYVPWAHIMTFVYQEEKEFDLFKLNLRNGEKMTFSIAHDVNHQVSFDYFYEAFVSKTQQLNEPRTDQPAITITKGKTFYEKPVGIGLAFLAAGVIVFCIAFIILHYNKRPIKWSAFFGATFVSLYYIHLVWKHNRKKA